MPKGIPNKKKPGRPPGKATAAKAAKAAKASAKKKKPAPQVRTHNVPVMVLTTEEDKASWVEKATESGMKLAPWVRESLNNAPVLEKIEDDEVVEGDEEEPDEEFVKEEQTPNNVTSIHAAVEVPEEDNAVVEAGDANTDDVDEVDEDDHAIGTVVSAKP